MIIPSCSLSHYNSIFSPLRSDCFEINKKRLQTPKRRKELESKYSNTDLPTHQIWQLRKNILGTICHFMQVPYLPCIVTSSTEEECIVLSFLVKELPSLEKRLKIKISSFFSNMNAFASANRRTCVLTGGEEVCVLGFFSKFYVILTLSSRSFHYFIFSEESFFCNVSLEKESSNISCIFLAKSSSHWKVRNTPKWFGGKFPKTVSYYLLLAIHIKKAILIALIRGTITWHIKAWRQARNEIPPKKTSNFLISSWDNTRT